MGIILVITTLAGLYLLGRGLLGVRVGQAPFCGSCGYNLTGRASECCPECGSALAGSTIVIGERRRRPALIVTGATLLALVAVLVGTGAATKLAHYNWYHLKPTRWVLKDVTANNDRLALKAYRELEDRARAGSLKEEQWRAGVDIAFADMAKNQPRPVLENAYVDFLNALRLAGKLSQTEETRFFEGILDPQLTARPRSIASVGIPAALRTRNRMGKPDFEIKAECSKIVLAGEDPGKFSRPSSFRGRGASGASSAVVKVPGPGEYEVRAKVRLRVVGSAFTNGPANNTLYTVEKTLTARSTVLAEEPADYLKVITDPKLERAVTSAIHVNDLTWTPQGTGIRMDLVIQDPPVDLSFRIRLFEDGREIGSGTFGMTQNKEKRTTFSTTIPCKQSDLRVVDVVLAPDLDVAKRSIDLTEIWGKPIRIDNVPVRRPATATASSPR